MTDDVLLSKVESMERCMKRIHEIYAGNEENLISDYNKQDAIILNLQRACEVAIDMGTHIIRIKHLGIPKSSAEVFTLLEKANFIPPALSHNLRAIVGFRNIAVHDYTTLNLKIVKSIIETKLDDFLTFSKLVLKIK